MGILPTRTFLPTCPNMRICYYKDRSTNDRVDAVKSPSAHVISCAAVPKKLDTVAARLFSGVSAVFFASLERCSCINISTKDDADADGGNLPLIGSDTDVDVRCTGDLMNGEDRTDGVRKDVIPIVVAADN